MGNQKAGRFQHGAHLAWRRVDEEAVILDLETSVYASLNNTATFVWARLGEGLSAEEIAEGLAEDYEVNPNEALKDVERLISEFSQQKFLVRK